MTQELLLNLQDSAQFSPCRNWRYTLHRRWADGPSVAFLMFNPSTADETQDDPTIRKCIGFARRWNFGRLVILNLFAIRGTDPRIVARVQDPIGPLNDYWILRALEVDGCRDLVCAWGCADHMKRDDLARRPGRIVRRVQQAIPHLNAVCLGVRGDGHPRHPLMLAYATERQPFEVPA